MISRISHILVFSALKARRMFTSNTCSPAIMSASGPTLEISPSKNTLSLPARVFFLFGLFFFGFSQIKDIENLTISAFFKQVKH